MPNQISNVDDYVSAYIGLGSYNAATLVATVDTQLSNDFGKGVGGSTTGNKVTIRYPAKFTTSSNVDITSDIQDILEDEKIITLSQRAIVPTNISDEEATLDFENGTTSYAKRVLEPMGKALISKIEQDGFSKISDQAQNVIVNEDPWADSDVLRQQFVEMRSRLDEQLAPDDDSYCTILGSAAEFRVANSMLPLFHNQKQIDKAFLEGTFDTFGGLKWVISNRVATRVNGAGGVAAVTISSYVSGSDTMVLAANVSGDIDALAVGDKLQFTGNSSVNNETKDEYGTLITRAVKTVSGSGTSITITIDPIYGPAFAGNRQNASAVPIATDAVVILGTAGGTYMVCPVYHKTAITLASKALYVPKGMDQAKNMPNVVNGVAQRYLRGFNILTAQLISRLESFYEWDIIQPEWLGVVELKVK